ncbi:hypothetical protein [Phaffia rhodozyma]|uniref:Uncharacterized protein n=1 Tax=Phaffia rhodozyma TaxID=264483 RepID=A0A0F7SMN1_PHARH|nr:hypothetical protein [Phaffia rhodozyma]
MINSRFKGPQNASVQDGSPSPSSQTATTIKEASARNIVAFKINTGSVPSRSLRVLFSGGLSREDYIKQLRFIHPEIFDRVSSNKVTFHILVGLDWFLVSDSSWDDVMVKRQQHAVLVKIKMDGLTALLYQAKWIVLIGLPFLALRLLVMGHGIVTLQIIVLFIYLMIRHMF